MEDGVKYMCAIVGDYNVIENGTCPGCQAKKDAKEKMTDEEAKAKEK